MLAAILAKRRKLAPHTLIEITETAAIADLDSAGKAIQVLRDMGYRVGLDDFGAGSASVNYLHAFQVDFAKFDGAMIQQIGASRRDDALLADLAKLCGEMGTTTIAEWIESEEMAKAARAMGFQQGQGKWLGAPVKEIPPAPSQQAQGRHRELGLKEPVEKAGDLARRYYDRNSTVIIILSGIRIFLKPVASLHSFIPEDGLSCWHCPPLAFSSRLSGVAGHPLPAIPRALKRIAPGPPAGGLFLNHETTTRRSVRLMRPPLGSRREVPGRMRSMP
jgi:hypothetical protein